MKRTTISLTDDLALVLGREARRRGQSMSEVARAALSEHFGVSGERRQSVPFAAVARSGHSDTAERVEELLEGEWDEDPASER